MRVQDYSNRCLTMQTVALIAIICGVVLSLPTLCESHSEQDPSFKYSREANENFDAKKATIPAHHHHDDHDGHHYHDHDHDHDHSGEEHSHHNGSPSSKRAKHIASDMTSIWLHSIGSTLLISAAPFVLLYVIPLDNSEAMKPRLKVLLAFASGGLLGDAFLHLIPHAAHPHSHSHEHGHDHSHDHSDHHHHSSEHNHGDEHGHGHDMTIGLWVLGGIVAFLAVEKLVRILNRGSGGHGHSHGGATAKAKPAKKSNEKGDSNAQTTKGSKKAAKEEAPEEVEISGYLNLAADFAHNFTDGLAIGASYLAGNSIGIVTTVTILLHEVPHEIGDFAILIKSGCSRRKAMLLQLVTALGAVAGTALALLGANGEDGSTSWVLPFTAGGFIYIATVSVLPELLEESTKLGQSIKEIVALLTGVLLMVFIANFE